MSQESLMQNEIYRHRKSRSPIVRCGVCFSAGRKEYVHAVTSYVDCYVGDDGRNYVSGCWLQSIPHKRYIVANLTKNQTNLDHCSIEHWHSMYIAYIDIGFASLQIEGGELQLDRPSCMLVRQWWLFNTWNNCRSRRGSWETGQHHLWLRSHWCT